MKSGDLIREARLRAGLSQAQLAERAGTTQSSIGRWEAGKVRPSLERLASLVRACGLEIVVALADGVEAEGSLIERNLALSPVERLDQLVRTLAFIREGRAALAARLG